MFLSVSAIAQYIPLQADKHFKSFLDELESEHVLSDFNQGTFDLSERNVFQLLSNAEIKSRQLNTRQKQELNFYLRYLKSTNDINRWYEYDVDLTRFGTFSTSLNPPGLFIRNKNSGFAVVPLAGAMYNLSGTDRNLHSHYGARISGNAGIFGYYFSFRKNNGTAYTYENYIQEHIPADGFSYRTENEMKAGISVANTYFTASAMFDNPDLFPVTSHMSVYNAVTPSFPSLLLTAHPLNWLSYQFRTGYINTSFDNYKTKNYLGGTNFKTAFAINQLILNPLTHSELIIGQAAFLISNTFKSSYLIPVNFYVSDNAIENTFFYYSINIAEVKHLNFTFSHIIDAFSLERMQSDYDRNVHALYVKAALSNWPVPDLTINAFYNYQSPLFMDHPGTPIYNLWLKQNLLPTDNKRQAGVEFVFKPTFNLSISAGYQRESVGISYDFTKQYPYEFETLNPVQRFTDILNFEFTIKPAYNTSLFAGIHYVNHKGEMPWFRISDYNEKVDFFFRTGFIIGL